MSFPFKRGFLIQTTGVRSGQVPVSQDGKLQPDVGVDKMASLELNHPSEQTQNRGAGQGDSPRFLPMVAPRFTKLIQFSQLSPASSVAVISVAGVECPGKTLLTVLLLRYLENRCGGRDRGRAASGGDFVRFLIDCEDMNVKELHTSLRHPGVYIWSRPFQLANQVVVFVLCAVGALQSDFVPGGVSPLLSRSVLCSSTQFIHLAEPSVRAHDCLHSILTSTDFLLYTTSSNTTQLYPQLHLLISDDGESSGDYGNKSRLMQARDTVSRRMVDQFVERAFPSGRCEQVKWPSIDSSIAEEIVDNLQLHRLPESYLFSVFYLFERVLGKGDAVPPLKLSLDGRAVTLGEFGRFAEKVCGVADRSELIPQWSLPAQKAFARKLCLVQVTDEAHLCEREATISAFSTHGGLDEMRVFNAEHPDRWNKLCDHWDSLSALWSAFDCQKKSSGGRAQLIHQMQQVLDQVKVCHVSEQYVRCQWKRMDHLIRGKCFTNVRTSAHIMLDKMARGGFNSTQQYIEARNAMLSVTKLLNHLPAGLFLLPQYRLLEFGIADVISWAIDMMDIEWTGYDQKTFAQIFGCRIHAYKDFCSQSAVILSNTGAGHCSGADVDRKLDDMKGNALRTFDQKVAMAQGSMDQDEFDYIVSDQRSVLCDQLNVWVAEWQVFSQFGLNGKCLVPELPKIQALHRAVQSCLLLDDNLAYCLRRLPVLL